MDMLNCKNLNMSLTIDNNRDGEVPSKKELSTYFEELLVVKFPLKRNLVPQMRNFSPTLDNNCFSVVHTMLPVAGLRSRV